MIVGKKFQHLKKKLIKKKKNQLIFAVLLLPRLVMVASCRKAGCLIINRLLLIYKVILFIEEVMCDL